jgi:prepilin peptidase CpaA
MPDTETIRFIATNLFIVLMLATFLTDLITMRIFNVLNAMILGSFLVFALLLQMPAIALAQALGTGLIGFAVGYALFALRVMGGGDVKFIAAVLPWFGWSMTSIEFVVLFSIYGGAMTLLFLFLRKFPLPVLAYRYDWIAQLHKPKGEVPYGLAMTIAAIQLSGSILVI